MKNISLYKFIHDSIEEDYAMDVLYYTIKKTFLDNNFSLQYLSSFNIDGRFFGETTNITLRTRYKTAKHALALLLSIRLLMLNHQFLELCEDDNLIFTSRPTESFQWVGYISFILDNWDDVEFKMLYLMLENFYFDEEFSEKEKIEFKNSIVTPEFKNEKTYYQNIAVKTTGISNNVIGNNAFLESSIERFVVPNDIVYIGNTAFAYCERLETLALEGKVMFGLFPIIECHNLKHIIVPTELLNYYKECLPYYKNIISDEEKEQEIVPIETSKDITQEEKNDKEFLFDESEIEHVYIDSPYANPYIETEDLLKENVYDNGLDENRKPIDVKLFESVFDRKTTSYKYFWLLSIISLAKEKGNLTINYKDILIRMAAIAWPIVLGDGIILGKQDMMAKYLGNVAEKTKIKKNAPSRIVENYLTKHYDLHEIEKMLSPLLKNVPYRFLSPWIKFTTTEEVVEKSNAEDFNGLYSLHPDHIEVHEDWWNYINTHFIDVCDFTLSSFISYVKPFNEENKLTKLMNTGWQLIKSYK